MTSLMRHMVNLIKEKSCCGAQFFGNLNKSFISTKRHFGLGDVFKIDDFEFL